MATVKHVEHPDGSHSIGVDIDGVYHAVAAVSAARVAQHHERVENLRARAGKGDQDAADVLAQVTGETGKPKGP